MRTKKRPRERGDLRSGAPPRGAGGGGERIKHWTRTCIVATSFSHFSTPSPPRASFKTHTNQKRPKRDEGEKRFKCSVPTRAARLHSDTELLPPRHRYRAPGSNSSTPSKERPDTVGTLSYVSTRVAVARSTPRTGGAGCTDYWAPPCGSARRWALFALFVHLLADEVFVSPRARAVARSRRPSELYTAADRMNYQS